MDRTKKEIIGKKSKSKTLLTKMGMLEIALDPENEFRG